MLNNKQRKQVQRQIAAYEKRQYVDRIAIPIRTKKYIIEIDPFVANPRIMNSGLQMVQYLLERPGLVNGKTVMDMGTGCGILGVVAGLLGARKVRMIDVSETAVANAKRNIQMLSVGHICEAFYSNLFSAYDKRAKADVIIFNHPFFAERPGKKKPWTRMMLGDTTLLATFLKQAPSFCRRDAVVIMPWMTLASHHRAMDNDPGKRAGKHGFTVVDIHEQSVVKAGMQRTSFKIYTLKQHAR